MLPLNVLLPFKDMSPAPTLVSEPVPLATPVYAVEVPSLPVVRLLERMTFPAPAREPIDWLNALVSKDAPEATVTALVMGITLAAPAFREPALIVVDPPKLLPE